MKTLLQQCVDSVVIRGIFNSVSTQTELSLTESSKEAFCLNKCYREDMLPNAVNSEHMQPELLGNPSCQREV